MSGFVERAMALRAQKEPHINCAQAVALPFGEAAGADGETLMRLAAGFGGGMRSGSVCGAYTGGVMALGLYDLGDPETQRLFRERFTEKSGGMTDCRDLLRYGVEHGLEKKAHCDGLVITAVTVVEELLSEKGKI